MATLKDVKNKIGGVKKTRQITKAMNMVAASRLRGAQSAMVAFRPYADKFSAVLGNLAERSGEEATRPLMVPHAEVNRIHVVLFTSDRGLCGGFNANLIAKAKSLVKEKKEKGMNILFTTFGKKGRDWCRKNEIFIDSEHLGVVGSRIGFTVASDSGRELIKGFLTQRFDEVYIIFSKFVSMARQAPVIQQILPIPSIEPSHEGGKGEDKAYLPEHICEPSPEKLVGEMLPRNIYVQLYHALLETSTSEHAARMTAMNNATKACNDMLDSLTLAYNKARQASITAELMDIIGGAEALKG
jgi:F-type H+-transporting ATPase subunit gamma